MNASVLRVIQRLGVNLFLNVDAPPFSPLELHCAQVHGQEQTRSSRALALRAICVRVVALLSVAPRALQCQFSLVGAHSELRHRPCPCTQTTKSLPGVFRYQLCESDLHVLSCAIRPSDQQTTPETLLCVPGVSGAGILVHDLARCFRRAVEITSPAQNVGFPLAPNLDKMNLMQRRYSNFVQLFHFSNTSFIYSR